MFLKSDENQDLIKSVLKDLTNVRAFLHVFVYPFLDFCTVL